MVRDVPEVISTLDFGDLIEIHWLDASEATGQLEHDRFDTSVQSVGYFLAVKGRKTKHVVIAKEIVDNKSLPVLAFTQNSEKTT